MKKLFTLAAFILSGCLLSAQNYCGSLRYDTCVFTNITVTSNVVYGWNKNLVNGTDTLKMDIYEPTGDTATIRPLIIMAHGGSFVGGSKTDMAYICNEFAKRGYVVASIDYRLGLGFPIDSVRATASVWRATQDMKASVRFFRKDAATANIYKIDPNMIFAGGASAGAIMAVHMAYLDNVYEIPKSIDTTQLGGIEGNSGNPGYSSDVKAVVNICGALADTCWMKAGDEDMVSIQGNDDQTVPYCSDYVYLLSFKIMIIHGLGTMELRANNIGLDNPVHTFYGQDHGSPGDSMNIDTTLAITSDFLYRQMGCTPSGSVNYANSPLCITNLLTTPSCVLNPGVNEVALNEENVSIYPNPSVESFVLKMKDVTGTKFSVEIHDMFGIKVRSFKFSGDEIKVDRKNLANGIYFLKLNSNAGESFTAKIIFTE